MNYEHVLKGAFEGIKFGPGAKNKWQSLQPLYVPINGDDEFGYPHLIYDLWYDCIVLYAY